MKTTLCLLSFALVIGGPLYGDDLFLAGWDTFRYPLLGVQAQIAGDVDLDVTVGPSGTVVRTRVVSGHRVLAEAAASAVRRWRFGRCDGETAQASETTVRFHFAFRLEGVVEQRPRTKVSYTHPWRVTVVGEAVHFQPGG